MDTIEKDGTIIFFIIGIHVFKRITQKKTKQMKMVGMTLVSIYERQ